MEKRIMHIVTNNRVERFFNALIIILFLLFSIAVFFSEKASAAEFLVLEGNMQPLGNALVSLVPADSSESMSATERLLHVKMLVTHRFSSVESIVHGKPASSVQCEIEFELSCYAKGQTRRVDAKLRAPLYGFTDEDGRLSLPIIAGEYNIVVWHPRFNEAPKLFLQSEKVSNDYQYAIRLKQPLNPQSDLLARN
jgi:hypothetical protein